MLAKIKNVAIISEDYLENREHVPGRVPVGELEDLHGGHTQHHAALQPGTDHLQAHKYFFHYLQEVKKRMYNIKTKQRNVQKGLSKPSWYGTITKQKITSNKSTSMVPVPTTLKMLIPGK